MDLTLSIDKSNFGIDKIIVVGYLCTRYDRKSNPQKIDAILKMKV